MMDREQEDLAYIMENTYQGTVERVPEITFEAYDDSLYWKSGDQVNCYAFDDQMEDMLFKA